MKCFYTIGLLSFMVTILAGCGAGVLHQTTKEDFQAMTYADAENKVKTIFYQGRSSIGYYYCNDASLSFTRDGFQVVSIKEGKQAFCDWHVGDPFVKDYGPIASERFMVHMNGCDAEVWFPKRETAFEFAKLIYTLKQLAVDLGQLHPSVATTSSSSVQQSPLASVNEITSRVVRSDVDILPSAEAKRNKHNYALVIGIEQYRQRLPRADFAVSDAKLVAEYLIKVLGYPEENVVILTDSTALKSDMEKYFEKWLSNHVSKESSVFIYYSGHGSPSLNTGDAYLVPYDGDPAFIDETGYSLTRMYVALERLPAKKVVIALDSCFSGAGGRSVIAKGTRSLVAKVKIPKLSSTNLTVLAASSEEQISATYDEKGHGLFTYFLLKGIKERDVVTPDASLKLEVLFDYLQSQVEHVARIKYNVEQTPQLLTPP